MLRINVTDNFKFSMFNWHTFPKYFKDFKFSGQLTRYRNTFAQTCILKNINSSKTINSPSEIQLSGTVDRSDKCFDFKFSGESPVTASHRTKGSPLWSLNLGTVCTSVHGCIRTHWEDQSSGIRSGESKWTRTWTEGLRAGTRTTDLCIHGGSRARDRRGIHWIFPRARSRLLVFGTRPWIVRYRKNGERTGTTDLSNWFDRRTRGILSLGIPSPRLPHSRYVAANFANGGHAILRRGEELPRNS